jgi:hypothetical protein
MFCSNCGADAVYVSGMPVANDVYYCAPCLPASLWELSTTGALNIPTQTKTKKAAAPVAPDASI